MSFKHCAVLIEKDGKYLFLRRGDNDSAEAGKWNPVNETPKEGETPEQTAVRGVKEEVGLDFKVSKRFPDWTPGNGHTTYIFVGSAGGQIKLNLEESSEYKWVSINEVFKLDLAFDYRDLLKHLFSII